MMRRTSSSSSSSMWVLLLLWGLTAAPPTSAFTPPDRPHGVATSKETTILPRHPHSRTPTDLSSLTLFDDGSGAAAESLSSTFLWGLRITSALTSYFGLIGFLDRPQGYLLDNANDYLEIKESQVPGAGLGLYAKVSLPRDTVLGTYPGVVIPLQQNLNKLKEYPPCEGYIWRFSDNAFVIDPTNRQGILDPNCVGGNPSMPLSMELHQYLLSGIVLPNVPTTLCRINEPPKGRDVNVVTDEDKEKRQVVFSLERDVYAGEEFFIDYGLSYDRSMYGGGANDGS